MNRPKMLMNQTKEEARLRVYLANENSLSDNPSLEYLRELQLYVKVWLGQIDKFIEETIKAQPTTVPVKKAVHLKYKDSGVKMYWNPDLGTIGAWADNPFWIDDPDTAKLMFSNAKRHSPVTKHFTIKLVHIKCKCTIPHLDWPAKYHTINCPLSKSR